MDRWKQVDVRKWSEGLSVGERASLRVPRRRAMARYVEQDAEDDATDLYEWVVGHELEMVRPQTFHICTRHPAARAALEHGLRPSFVCPLANRDCPMRAMLDASGGRGIRFVR